MMVIVMAERALGQGTAVTVVGHDQWHIPRVAVVVVVAERGRALLICQSLPHNNPCLLVETFQTIVDKSRMGTVTGLARSGQ
jgi:hypothetical protein